MRDEALWSRAAEISVFAEVDPNQTGHVVGYLGDGINDAPALHAARYRLHAAGSEASGGGWVRADSQPGPPPSDPPDILESPLAPSSIRGGRASMSVR